TVPTVVSRASIFFRIATRSPPVERSMIASAPFARAAPAFFSSSGKSHRVPEVPTFTFTLTVHPSPMAQERCRRFGFAGMTTRPAAIRRAICSGSMPSARAASATGSGTQEAHLRTSTSITNICWYALLLCMKVRWIPEQGALANSYIFGTILVDAGVFPMAIQPFRDEIDTIVLTHCHFDHTAHVKEISHMCR